MRAVMVCPDEIPGTSGGAVHFLETAKGLVKIGHETHLVTKQYSSQRKIQNIAGVRIHRVNPVKEGLGYNAIRIAMKAFSLKPDVIITRDFYYTLFVILISWFIPRCIPIIFEGLLLRINGFEPKQLALSRWKYGLANWSLKKCMEWADAVSVQSSFAKECCIKMGIDPRKIHTIPPTVDINRFDQSKYSDKTYWKKVIGLSSYRVVTYAGSLDPWQNINTLIKAIPQIQDHLTDIMFLFLISKKDYDRGFEIIKKLRKGAITKTIPHNEMPIYLAASDVFVIPRKSSSVMTELELPTKILEAIAMEVPVVAARVNPIKELIKNGKDGLLFDPNSPEELSRAIIKILCDNDLSIKLAKNAKQKIVKYSIEEKAIKVERLSGYCKKTNPK